MDFWQQYQGFFWVGLLIVLPVVGVIVKRRVSRFSARAAHNLQTGTVVANSGMPIAEKAKAELGTVLTFRTSAADIAPTLTNIKLPLFWRQISPTEWQLPVTKQDLTPSAIVVLEDTDKGSQLALTHGEESMGIIMTDSPWRKIRRNAAKAVEVAGMVAVEEAGTPLVRVPVVDTTGMSPAEVGLTKHRWERPAS